MTDAPDPQTALDFTAAEPEEQPARPGEAPSDASGIPAGDAPAHRHFCGWAQPLLPQAARLLVERYRTEGVARMDAVVVALPGARAGRRLKELLVEAAAKADVRLVPPRVVTLGILPELLYEVDRRPAPGLLRRLAWAEALAAADREVLGRVFARLPEDDTLADWLPLARELAALAREVAAGGHDFRSVAATCSGTPLYDDAGRWRVLAGVQDAVGRRLESLDRMDRDAARRRALAEGTARLPGDLWLVGAAELPGVLARLLTEGAERGSQGGSTLHAVVHAPEERAHAFGPLGQVLPDAWQDARVEIPDDWIRVVDTPADQARAAVAVLAALEPPRPPEAISLGVPDPDVVPALEETLDAAGVRGREAAGRALSTTGPFRLLQAVAAFLPERRYEALAALVRHPDLSALLGEPEVNRILEQEAAERSRSARRWSWVDALDAWYLQHLPARMVAPYPDRARGAGRVVAELMSRIDELLLPLGGRERPLSGWVASILQLLARVYADAGLDPSNLAHRSRIQALEKLRGAAGELTSLPAEVDRTLTGAAALQLLLQEAAGEGIPPAPDPDALELLGWLELHLDDAPVTVVTGVNEGFLPASVRGDPFLPDSLRRLLGLEDNRQRYARDLYRLTAMRHSREVLRLVAGRRSTAGDPLRPSRLLFAEDEETVHRRVQAFWGGGAAGAGTGAADGGPAAAGSGDEGEGEAGDPGPEGLGESMVESAFRLPPEPYLPALGEAALPASMSVTEFSRILDDRYTWALRRFRGVEPENDRQLEMDPGLFGSVAHEVLQAFGRDEIRRHAEGDVVTDPDRVWTHVERLLDAHVESRFGEAASRARVAVRLQVEQLRSRLRAFAHWHAGWVGQGWRVRAAEVGTGRDGIGFTFAEGGATGEGGAIGEVGATVRLKARIDRIDEHPASGRWAVFDYKTSDSGKDPEKTHRRGRSEPKVWTDLQLPLYRWLARRLPCWQPGGEAGTEAVGPGPSAGADIRVGYILLPRSLEKTGEALAEWDDTLLEDGVERAREILRELAAGPVEFDENSAPTWREEELDALTGRSVLSAGGPDDDEDA